MARSTPGNITSCEYESDTYTNIQPDKTLSFNLLAIFERKTDQNRPFPLYIDSSETNTGIVRGNARVFVELLDEDVMKNRIQENVTVHIDHTVPDINNMWLVRNKNRELYVHNSRDLSDMVLEFDASDPHSGIYSVEWFLGTQLNTSDIGKGYLPVIKLSANKTCQVDQHCYCPYVGSCAYYNYTVKLNHLVNENTNMGTQDREYYFTLMVTNTAMLKSVCHLDILVDASPPVAGVVLEGPPGGPDIDYTSEDHVYINMHGFIDHESGIRLYRVALAERCLTLEELRNAGNASIVIVYKTVNPIIKLSFPNSGLFYSSAVAFNNAMEPSIVVCSDGITKDTTPPMMTNIILKNGQMYSGLWCKNAKAWYVDKNMTLIELQQTPACQKKCKHHKSLGYVGAFPLQHKAINDNDTSEDICSRSPILNNESVIYLPSDKIYLKWKTNEPESQIRDYVIGIGDDKSQTDVPLVRSYESTHGKEFFHLSYSGLTSTSIFYIFMKVINKAGLSSVVVLGPVMIDETSLPRITETLQPRINNNGIKDPEKTGNQFTVL
ncbi:uncharacterized protein LOC121368680 [Gigantopelta aegis]|uniref:uncharacterized protein LOC121368680 n=1 Tax=Gigantopelta aegis TaxID=1735272 RepID=UPI001B8888D5|nr:uncharacterized protein LOC121368680 [Gigantopelta aegis]